MKKKLLKLGILIECNSMTDVRIMEILVNKTAVNYNLDLWINHELKEIIDVESHTLLDSDYAELFAEGCRDIYEVEKKGNTIYILCFDPDELGDREVINCKSLVGYDIIKRESDNDYNMLKHKSSINISSQVFREMEIINGF